MNNDHGIPPALLRPAAVAHAKPIMALGPNASVNGHRRAADGFSVECGQGTRPRCERWRGTVKSAAKALSHLVGRPVHVLVTDAPNP